MQSDSERTKISLSGKSNSHRKAYFILPDRAMSVVRIVKLPRVPRNKLAGLVRFQVMRIYPAKDAEVQFDYIACRQSGGWTVVIYILNRKYMEELSRDRNCRGILLPPQFMNMKKLHGAGTVYVLYPDMLEEWKLEAGIPSGVRRADVDELSDKRQLDGGCALVCGTADMPSMRMKQGFLAVMDFSELRNAKIRIRRCRVNRSSIWVLLVPLTGFFVSLLLLINVHYRQQNIQNRISLLEQERRKAQSAAAEIQEKLEQVTRLGDELKSRNAGIPVNLYHHILRAARALDADTAITSIVYEDGELKLELKSMDALKDLRNLYRDFTQLNVSGISRRSDGADLFTVWIRVGNESTGN